MGVVRRWLLQGIGLAAILMAGCSSNRAVVGEKGKHELEGGCVQTTIDDLALEPSRYSGRNVCAAGFFGTMVPYGETTADLYRFESEAQSLHANVYLQLALPLNADLQERLSRYSVQWAIAEGVFEYDPRCWPAEGQQEPNYRCFPPRQMRLVGARLRFPDGAVFP